MQRTSRREDQRKRGRDSVPVLDAEDKVEQDGDKDETAHDERSVRLVCGLHRCGGGVGEAPLQESVPITGRLARRRRILAAEEWRRNETKRTVVTSIAHHDPVPPNAVHGPRVPEHGTRDDSIDDAHRPGSPVLVVRRVEQGERERREEQRDSEPGEEGSFGREPDLRVCVRVRSARMTTRRSNRDRRHGTFGSILDASAPSFCIPSPIGAPFVAP